IAGPDRLVRFNLYPSADINGNTMDGYSTGQSLATMEQLADENLPPGFGYAWTELAYQEKQANIIWFELIIPNREENFFFVLVNEI
ncbi:MAG: efflux RND transporter permease subunit, partial [Sedimentisphaerales bacterium]|nr:efflux RND transporter permease subunit [Sedimentisphaerales bacterium]